MRRYEIILIINPDLSEEKCAIISSKFISLIEKYNGVIIEKNSWGKRKLAYEIKKKTSGHYIYFDFCSETFVINEIEQVFGIEDNVLKFMTVLLNGQMDINSINDLVNKKTQNSENDQKEDNISLKSEEQINNEGE